jgi:hypothetical protein
MKTRLLPWLTWLLVLTLALPSCKKGEEDPYLSLRSRKNRLVGYWQLEAYTLSRDFGDIRSIAYDADAEQLIITDEDSVEVRRSFTWSIEFDREGGYEAIETERIAVDTVETPFQFTETRTTEGQWEFTGGNGEPAKSQLLLLPTVLSATRSNQGANIEIQTIDGQIEGMLWNMDRLSSSELWLSYEVIKAVAFNQETETVSLRFSKTDAPSAD